MCKIMRTIHKYRLKNGKHPSVIKDKNQILCLEQFILSLDSHARFLPTRFKFCHGNERRTEVLINQRNKKEIFLKISDKRAIQNFKIECSSEQLANIIYKKLLEYFNNTTD